MNINTINLNLLRILDALLTEKHVTRAGNKLFLSQSTISNALAQLRQILDDQLLVRGPKGMTLTPRATELAPKIRQIFSAIEETLQTKAAFDPLTSTREFRIGMSDYTAFILLPKLMKTLAQQAPHIKLKILHMNTIADHVPFTNHDICLGTGLLVTQSPHLHSEKLFSDYAVCAADAHHPLMKKTLTKKLFQQTQFIAITFQTEPLSTITDQALQRENLRRDVVLSVPHVIPALHAMKGSKLMVIVPFRIAHALQKII